jgi:hypothetical protein
MGTLLGQQCKRRITMELYGKIWVSMTWEKAHVRYISSEPAHPCLLRGSFQQKNSYDVFDCAYNSKEKTGRVFLLSEPDEDDEDEGPWYHEYIYKGEAPITNMPCNGSLYTVRLRFSGG